MKMNLVALLFVFLSFTVAKILVLEDSTETAPDFDYPSFDVPEANYKNDPNCSTIEGCIRFLGNVFFNIGVGLIFIIELFVETLEFLFDLVALIIEVQFTGFEGAPWWINLLFTVPFIVGFGILIYKTVRKGDDE